MESLLTNFSETHRILSYLIIFFGMFVEGEVILLLAGVLSHRGYLDVFDVMMIASIGAILHDVLYWSIGIKFSRASKGKFLFINLEKTKEFLEKVNFNNGLYIFISKFSWNLNRLALITSGYLKTPIKSLLRYSVPAGIIWSITFTSLGYVFAFETSLLRKDIATAGIFLAIFIVAVIILEVFLKKLLIKRK